MVLKKVVSSPVSRSFLPLAVFFLLALLARPAAAGAQGLYHATGGRQANGIVYLKMHESTSLRPDGSGEERLEFTVTNDSLTPVETAEFYFQVGSTDYWGIRAWDADGNLDYGVVVEDNYIHITIYYRDSVGLAEEYTYFFAINFPGLAQESGGQWEIDWVTSFPVVEFIRTINLPGGAEVVAVDPPPTTQSSGVVEWVRAFIVEFQLHVAYTLRPLSRLELAEEYAPYFRRHEREAYVPMSVDLALRHADCITNPIPFINQCFPPGELTLQTLMAEWLDRDNSFVNFRGNPILDVGPIEGSHEYYLANVKAQADLAPTLYARVIPVGADHTVIQYWLYFYYNAWGLDDDLPGVLGLHEGDWEMIQVVLDGDKKPQYATYAQHLGATRKEWNDLEHIQTDGDHPVVYTGLGSHASYFGPYRYLAKTDLTGESTAPLLKPAVHLLQEADADRWVGYRGQWGEPGLPNGGPSSPANQGQKWSNPLGWSEGGVDWDEFAGHHLGKIRAHTNSPCHVGVEITDTGESFGWVHNEYKDEIDGGEYIDNQTNQTRSLILHETYTLTTWLAYLYRTCPDSGVPTGRPTAVTPELTVEFYDETLDEVVIAEYDIPVGWQPDTIATLQLGDRQALDLAVDVDGDGATDQIVPPQSVTTVPVVPPGPGDGTVFVPVVLVN